MTVKTPQYIIQFLLYPIVKIPSPKKDSNRLSFLLSQVSLFLRRRVCLCPTLSRFLSLVGVNAAPAKSMMHGRVKRAFYDIEKIFRKLQKQKIS